MLSPSAVLGDFVDLCTVASKYAEVQPQAFSTENFSTTIASTAIFEPTGSKSPMRDGILEQPNHHFHSEYIDILSHLLIHF